MNKEDTNTFFKNSITEKQKKEISELSGIGQSEHFLGAPQLADVKRNGESIGWGHTKYKGVSVLQPLTDMENWNTIINSYKPEIYIECGVANGGNLFYIYDLMKEYCEPIVYGIDIEDVRHDLVKQNNNLNFILSNVLNEDVVNKIKEVLDNNSDKRCLIHLDDHHESSHVIKELNLYSKLLKQNDIIIIGDTWDEGWYNSPYQALLDSYQENESSYFYDKDMNQKMIMPCNWIFGILIKK